MDTDMHKTPLAYNIVKAKVKSSMLLLWHQTKHLLHPLTWETKVITKPCYKSKRESIMVMIKTGFSLMGSITKIPFTRWVNNLRFLGGSQTDAPKEKGKTTNCLTKANHFHSLFSYQIRLKQDLPAKANTLPLYSFCLTMICPKTKIQKLSFC